MEQEELQKLMLVFKHQKHNARRRRKTWELTFEQWLKVWTDSGHLHERGTLGHQYCMSRLCDYGPYNVDNVFIQTVSENCRDGNLGRNVKHRQEPCPKCGRMTSTNAMHVHLKACAKS